MSYYDYRNLLQYILLNIGLQEFSKRAEQIFKIFYSVTKYHTNISTHQLYSHPNSPPPQISALFLCHPV